MLAKHKFIGRNSDRLRRHDLITQWIAYHAVLMDAGFMCERVPAHNRFVWLDTKTNNAGKHLTGRINLARLDSSLEGETIRAHVDGHDDFFQRSVAGPLANAIDRAFNLPGAGIDRGQAVGDRQSEVVVTMNADGNAGSIPNHS